VEEPSRSHAAGVRPRPQAAGSVPYTVVHTGTKYTAADLGPQVSASLPRTAPTGPRALSAADDSLNGCIARVGGGKTPLLVDTAAYEGRSATVIALPGNDARHADVWVVGLRCSAADTDLIAHRQVARGSMPYRGPARPVRTGRPSCPGCCSRREVPPAPCRWPVRESRRPRIGLRPCGAERHQAKATAGFADKIRKRRDSERRA
jgi:hypothetical protein